MDPITSAHGTGNHTVHAMKSNGGDISNNKSSSEQAVVLFYHYFAESSASKKKYPAWWQNAKKSLQTLYTHQRRLCQDELQLRGRVLIAEEGINGTLAGRRADIDKYIQRMTEYHHAREKRGMPQSSIANENENENDITSIDSEEELYFRHVDWKVSTVKSRNSGNNSGNNDDTSTDLIEKPLFPDLKISMVKEIVSTGGLVDVHAIPNETGKHLSPEEFHRILTEQPDIALIDVRNTFEHNIGHFVNPETGEKAIDPQMTTFASFDKFCDQHKDQLKDRQVLMYCTGGIRCEKASILLKRKGVSNVSQLS
ncbi:MAG: hypothetical protein SGILL_000515, partial [Bacillariaceae sp.]